MDSHPEKYFARRRLEGMDYYRQLVVQRSGRGGHLVQAQFSREDVELPVG
jgi:hypothetical protein